jgi:hypothetical protein
MLNSLKKWFSGGDEVERQISDLSAEKAALIAKEASLRNEVQVFLGRIKEYEKQTQELKAEIDILVSAKQEAENEDEANRNQLQKELEQSREKNTNLEKRALELEHDLQKQETELQERQRQVQNLGSTIEIIEAKLKNAHAEIDVIKSQHDAEIKDLAEQIKDADHKLMSLKNSALRETDHDSSLLIQLHDAQEKFAEQFEINQGLLRSCVEHDSFWQRLLKMYPGFFDFDVELIPSSAQTGQTELVWRLNGFNADGISLEPFIFKIFLLDGYTGIKIDSSGEDKKELTFFPHLIAGDRDNLRKFKGITYRKYWAAIKVVEKVIQSKWAGIDVPRGIDKTFWNSFLINLVKNAQLVPPVFRYDLVKIKRELLNQDYEHIWLELEGVTFGNFNSRKLEFRIGASSVHPGAEFTRFPKIEFPLVDGRQKPFTSWYPESVDDFGSKFELRFALDKSEFDVAVWNRLNVEDKQLIAAFMIELPSILENLRDQQYAIARGWNAWLKLADETVGVFYARLSAIAKNQKEKVSSQVNDKNMELPKPISVQIKKKPPAIKKLTTSKTKTVSGAKKNV